MLCLGGKTIDKHVHLMSDMLHMLVSYSVSECFDSVPKVSASEVAVAENSSSTSPRAEDIRTNYSMSWRQKRLSYRHEPVVEHVHLKIDILYMLAACNTL